MKTAKSAKSRRSAVGRARGGSRSEPLRECEKRLEDLLQISSEIYWEQDENYRFTVVTGGHFTASGTDASIYIGHCRWDHGALPAGESESWDQHKAALEARRPFTDFLYKRLNSAGELRFIRTSGRPVFDDGGRFRGYRGIAKDVTEGRRADELLKLEHSVARCLSEVRTVSSAMREIMRAVCETQHWELGRYFVVDEHADLLRFAGAWAASEEELRRQIERCRDMTYARGVGLAGLGWRDREPQWAADLASDPRASSSKAVVTGSGMRGAFVFPVVAAGKVISVFAFNSREVRKPDERLLAAVKVIGSQIGQFLVRLRAEEDQHRFRAALDASADLMLLIDPAAMRYVDANDAACRALGYTREELLALGPQDIFSRSREELASLYQELFAGELKAPTVEGFYRRKDGSTLLVEAFPRPVSTSQDDIVVTIARDIGARKRAELLLDLEHAVTRCISEADSAAEALKSTIRAICESQGWDCGRYFRRDGAGGDFRFCESWNVAIEAVDRFIEWSREKSYAAGVGLVGRVGQAGESLWIPDVSKDARVLYQALSDQHGMRGAFIFPVKSQGATIGVLAFNSREIREPDERLLRAVLVIGSQIGQFLQRKQAEDVMRESEARFRSLIELSTDTYWEQDEELRFTSLTGPGIKNVHGKTFSGVGKKRWELGFINMSEADWAAHRAVLEARKPFRELELCRITESGNKGWLSVSGEAVHDASGRFKGYRGVGKDITARKRAEELLRLEHAVTRCLADADKVGTALEHAIRAICETEGWECGRYLQVDDEAGVLRFGAAWGAESPAIERFLAGSRAVSYAPGVGLAGRVWQSGQPLWVADLEKDSRTVQKTATRELGLHGAVFFPVMSQSATNGVLAFNCREVREPDERLLQTVRIIGNQIGQFVRRKQAEDRMRESEERFRGLTQLSSDMYWEQDEQFRFTSFQGIGSHRVNKGTLRQIGRKRWEQSYINMTPDAWAEHIAALEAHKPFRDMELCRLSDDGKKVWISISGEPVFDSAGAFRGYRGVGKDITERKLDEERIQYLATHDALTALPNRTMFSSVLNVTLENARRYGRSFAVLFVDLDRFKVINDTLGHEAGDRLLQEMGARLTQTVRASDVVARLGGDEFVVLVQEVGEPKQVETVARKILSALIKPVPIGGQDYRVTASIGICMYPSDAEDEQALMKNADIAMYHAKEEGKNTFKFYSAKTDVHTFERLALETSLRRALERREFFLHYQAKLDLHNGRISGVEALVRWQHPELGMVPPGQFIPLAEETGLIVPIGKWVLNAACAQNVAWQREGLPALRISVNISARQFADEDLLQDVADALRETGMAPELLELELTESMVMQNTERAAEILAAIKKMGVRLAIDDFGVGYSSLTQLKRFPIDTLKVDRSFIRDIPQDVEDKAITEAIIAMGKSLNLTIVAEGVETLEQQTFLQDRDCDEMQGYYFSKPIAAEKFAALLRERMAAAPSASLVS